MINVYKYEGIDEEDCLIKCIEELDVYNCDIFDKNIEDEESYKIEVVIKEDVSNFNKEYIKNLGNKMNIKINMEVREEEDIFNITMVSNNNPILIGKDGKNLNSIQYLLRQAITNQTGFNIKVNLDSSNYRTKKVRNFEYRIKNIVRKVQKNKIDTKLDLLDSYQRRIIHSLLIDFSNVTTESVGEERK